MFPFWFFLPKKNLLLKNTRVILGEKEKILKSKENINESDQISNKD